MKLLNVAVFITAALCETILLTNDDSWASTNIRAAYRDLKKEGYDVILVAPVSQRSGWGGKFDVPSSKDLENDGEFSYVKRGDPSWGHEDDDSNIWYFNGTPSSCVSFALDYLLPNNYDNKSIDLIIGGPNEGPNVSPGFFTASGTMSAIYYGIYRGIPGISFSGSNQTNSFFKDSLNDDKDDPANIYSNMVVDLTKKVFKNSNTIPPLTGLNVNFPFAGKDDSKCSSLKWKSTRMMDLGILNQYARYNSDSGTFEWAYSYYPNIADKCETGNCSLDSEYETYTNEDCIASVTVFGIDYDASSSVSKSVFDKLSL